MCLVMNLLLLCLWLQAHVEFFLRNPVHIIADLDGKMYVGLLQFQTDCLSSHSRTRHKSTPICSVLFVFLLWYASVRTDPIPYGLRFPEDFVACSLVTQAAIGHEDRLVFRIDVHISKVGTITLVLSHSRYVNWCYFVDMCRFEDKILEGPDYFPMWVHHLKRNRSYVACATGVNCTGEPNYRNTMPSLDDLVLPHL